MEQSLSRGCRKQPCDDGRDFRRRARVPGVKKLIGSSAHFLRPATGSSERYLEFVHDDQGEVRLGATAHIPPAASTTERMLADSTRQWEPRRLAARCERPDGLVSPASKERLSRPTTLRGVRLQRPEAIDRGRYRAIGDIRLVPTQLYVNKKRRRCCA